MQDLCVSVVYLVPLYCESNGSYLSVSVMPFTDSGWCHNPVGLHLCTEHGQILNKCC
jgi:hypothetical protein